jgi:hypothetical protein
VLFDGVQVIGVPVSSPQEVTTTVSGEDVPSAPIASNVIVPSTPVKPAISANENATVFGSKAMLHVPGVHDVGVRTAGS